MVQTKEELLAILHRHEAVFRALGVARFGLFGSFTRNVPTAKSDIDLLVEFVSGQKTFTNFSAVAEFLEQETGRPVELITPEALSPHLGPRILREVEYVSINA